MLHQFPEDHQTVAADSQGTYKWEKTLPILAMEEEVWEWSRQSGGLDIG